MLELNYFDDDEFLIQELGWLVDDMSWKVDAEMIYSPKHTVTIFESAIGVNRACITGLAYSDISRDQIIQSI